MPEAEPARQSSRIRTGTEEGTQQEPVSAGSSFGVARGGRGGRPCRQRGEIRRGMTNGSGAGGADADSPLGPQKVNINRCFHRIIVRALVCMYILSCNGNASPVHSHDRAAHPVL